MNILQVLAHDKNIKLYRPELNAITGSVTATLLLMQMIYWGIDENGEAVEFYKFKQPCNHDLYKKGDSWCEELGITEEEFDTAIKKIGFKRGKSPQGQVAKNEESSLVVYYTDSSRLTKYTVNVGLLSNRLLSVYCTITEITTETTSEPKPIINRKEVDTNEVTSNQLTTHTPIGLPKVAQVGLPKQKSTRSNWGTRPTYQQTPKINGTLEDSLRDNLPILIDENGVERPSPEIQELAKRCKVLNIEVWDKKKAYVAWVKSKPNDPSRWGLDMASTVEVWINRALASGELEKNLTGREQVIAAGYEISGESNE